METNEKKVTVLYEEFITSSVTEALFAGLALLFLGLSVRKARVIGSRLMTRVYLFFGIFFLFYVINYRRLVVRITNQDMHLRFGIFHWAIPLENIQRCEQDDVVFTRLGGAGIHFAMVGGRYRANFNFLDQPRVLVRLKEKQGLVQDVSFSTRQPEEVMRLIREGVEQPTA